jgi:ring-1,2-phenylacetyl-CoA epoxidase subunit PaaC
VTPALIPYALARADDALILGHRLSEWTGRAPMLEEELALANIGLDLIGQSRALYSAVATVEARDEDFYPYRREERAFANMLLLELPNGDFARTMLRQLLYSAYALPYWQAMARMPDQTMAGIAAKAVKEVSYHLRHAREWVIRLGDGTEESHARCARALDELWPYTGEIFARDERLIAEGLVVDPETLRPAWNASIDAVLAEATLTRPAAGWMQKGGRQGRHSEHLGFLLAELQHLQRSHPGATW